MEQLNVNNLDELHVPIPKKHPKKLRYFFILFLVLVLVVSAWYFYTAFKKIPVPTKPKELSRNEIVARDSNSFIRRSLISFPAVVSTTTIELSSLPVSVNKFITNDAVLLKASQINFENNKSGYSIEYNTATSIKSLHAYLSNPSGWTKLQGMFNENAAMSSYENQNVDLQVVETFIDASTTKVSITAINR